MSEAQVLLLFPRLSERGFKITSPKDTGYNCIAWAAGDNRRWWQPGIIGQSLGLYYWPTLTDDTTLEVYEEAFASLGYVRCDNTDLEPGFEKIILYVDAHRSPTHAARQLSDGTWTSKLGKIEDICHLAPEGVCGKSYGEMEVIMRRSIGSNE
jgi:hypothetical protein